MFMYTLACDLIRCPTSVIQNELALGESPEPARCQPPFSMTSPRTGSHISRCIIHSILSHGKWFSIRNMSSRCPQVRQRAKTVSSRGVSLKKGGNNHGGLGQSDLKKDIVFNPHGRKRFWSAHLIPQKWSAKQYLLNLRKRQHPCIRRLSPQYERQLKLSCPTETTR